MGILLETLHKFGISILSSGRSSEEIRRLGFSVTDITEYTDFQKVPDSLVKTLHHKIYCSILLDPSKREHRKYMEKHQIMKIDMVIVNFYPLPRLDNHSRKYIQNVAKNIDIGGPAIARAAAKAALLHSSITIVTDTNQYPIIIKELKRNNGEICDKTKRQLALQAFDKTRSYDEKVLSVFSSMR